MGFIYQNKDIKDRRVKIFIDRLYHAFTRLMVVQEQAFNLINEPIEKAAIATLATNPSDTFPLLPFGDELVFQFGDLGFDFESDSKFLIRNQDAQIYQNILDVDIQEPGEVLPDGVVALTNSRVKIKDGLVILKNLEQYQYDYKSYEVLNEIYRAVEIFLSSVEILYSKFYQTSLGIYKEANNDYDDSGSDEKYILVYDVSDIDDEYTNRILPQANLITNLDAREEVLFKYRQLRDTIQFFGMNYAVVIDRQIDNLLFAVNGSKKYSIRQNIETKQLEVIIDDNGNQRRAHKEEEVFFPFHNKAILDQFTIGLREKW